MRLRYDTWSVLALCRFGLALIVAVNHLAEFTALGWLAVIPRFGAFEAILGFLAISGFSIGSSFNKQPAGFLKRRAWRIWPVYLAAMVLAWLARGDRISPNLIGVLAQNVIFFNQFTTTSSYVGPAWSLSLEVWLYCLTPLLATLSTRAIRWLMFASFAGFCCYELGRSALHWPYYAGVGFGLNLGLLSFAWLCGFTMARSGSTKHRSLKDCAALFSGYLVLACLITAVHRAKTGELTVLLHSDLPDYLLRAATLGTLWLVFRALVRGDAGRVRSATMRLLGDISYPLYLVHGSVFVLTLRVFQPSVAPNAALCIGIALTCATLIFYGLDSYGRRRERGPSSLSVEAPDAACQRQRPASPPDRRGGHRLQRSQGTLPEQTVGRGRTDSA